MTISKNTPWQWMAFPVLSILFVVLYSAFGADKWSLTSPAAIAVDVVMIVIMMGTVFAAVYHAELIAVRVGEPFGTIVLTLAVTIIEVALIASLMLMPDSNAALARDTVFAVVMIVCNGLVGICVLLGGLRYREQEFKTAGTAVYLTVLGTLAVLTLVLPNYTQATPGPFFSTAQLVFVSVVTVVLYAVFLFIQTIKHTDYFTQSKPSSKPKVFVPGARLVAISSIFLLLSLVSVVLIAKKFAVVLEAGLAAAGAPAAAAGVIVAMIVLAPEGISAVRAAQRDVLQKSLNLALGSSLATIGLTIPAVAVTSVVIGKGLVLGLAPRDTMLLALTLFISLVTFGTGRTNTLYGFVHLVVFATFLFFTFTP